jgi:hypothetical protein
MSRPLALLLAAAAALALLLLPAATASAAPAATVSPSTVKPGGSFTVSGTGCWDPAYDPASGEEVQWSVGVVTAFGPGYAETTGVPGGNWSVTIQVSPSWHPGGGSVEAFCRLSNDQSFHYPKLWVTIPPPAGTPTGFTAPVPAPSRTTAGVPPRPTTTQAPPTGAAPAPPAADLSAPATTSAGAAPALALGCPDCTRLTTDERLMPGTELTLLYGGFQPGEQVTFVMRSTPIELGTFVADAAGTVTAEVTIPDTAEAGSHTLTMSGPVTGELVVGFRLAGAEPIVASPVGEESALPRLLGLGAAVLALGVGVPVLLRRRRAQPELLGVPDQETETPISEPIA